MLVQQGKKPNLFKSKSFSLNSNDGSLNERKRMIETNISIHNCHEDVALCCHAEDRRKHPYNTDLKTSNGAINEKEMFSSQSPKLTRSPLKILRPEYSFAEEVDSGRDPIRLRVPMKRRRSFMPATNQSRSFRSNENTCSSPGRLVIPHSPIIEVDCENNNDNRDADKVQIPAKRRNSFMPITKLSLSPKPGFKMSSISSVHKTARPPLLRTLSYTASTDTGNTEISQSDHTRSSTSTPAQNNDQNLETLSSETNRFANICDLDKSSTSTASLQTASVEDGCLKESHGKNMSFARSLSLVVGMFLWHYLKVIGLTLNLKTILVKIWMTLFDVLVGAVSISVELISYTIPIMVRLFETSMLWFVQQVYIRRIFVYLYEALKHRKKHDAVVEQTTPTEPTLSPKEKISRRPMRFLSISKNTVRSRSVRVANCKD